MSTLKTYPPDKITYTEWDSLIDKLETRLGSEIVGDLLMNDTKTINAGSTTDDYFTIDAFDTGNAMVEVGRVVGAADPYVSFGGSQEFKFYNSGTSTLPTITGVTTFTSSGNLDIGAYDFRAATFQSDIATGTAPLTVASTTLVTNLNADRVDGLHLAVGDATVLSGATTVVVTHGMSGTPRVLLTPKDEIEGRDYWVSAEGALTFTINISMIDLANGHSFNWMGIV